jgi:hypothetical protein
VGAPTQRWRAARRWLAPEYRRALVVRELLGYHADVLCLQEVDESFFAKSLRPHLDGAGAPISAPAAPPAAGAPALRTAAMRALRRVHRRLLHTLRCSRTHSRRIEVLDNLFQTDCTCAGGPLNSQELPIFSYGQPSLPCPAGFDGHYTNKAGSTREGCATFWRRGRLRLVRRADVALKELFAALAEGGGGGVGGGGGGGGGAAPGAARHARFAPMLRDSPALAAALQKARGFRSAWLAAVATLWR